MDAIKQQLVKHIQGGEAFLPIDKLLPKIPFEALGTVIEGLPYTIWQQFHHLSFCQKDILDFSIDPNYTHYEWPKDYWTTDLAPIIEEEWEVAQETYFKERQTLIDLILDPKIDLNKPFAHGTGQTLFREALLVIEHTAYHTGQILVMARKLGLI